MHTYTYTYTYTTQVERASAHTAVARFSFDELCGRPLGAEDFIGIATAFHTVFLEGVPQLTRNDINRVSIYIPIYMYRIK